MAQQEVLKLLNKYKGRKFRVKDIAASLKISTMSAQTNVSRLLRSGFVKRKAIQVQNGYTKNTSYEYWV